MPNFTSPLKNHTSPLQTIRPGNCIAAKLKDQLHQMAQDATDTMPGDMPFCDHSTGSGNMGAAPKLQNGLQPSQRLILLICAGPDNNLAEHFAALSEADWITLVDQAIAKRIGLLLDRALTRANCQPLLPAPCRAAIEDERRRLTMSAFGHMLALTEAVAFLRRHNIVPVALKGARLAYRDYPEARLRPLRDIDLLVPADQAERAQQLMIDSGTYEVASWAGYYGIEFGHQLPELLDTQRGVSFEIHHRLNARGWAEEPQLVAMVLEQNEDMAVSGAAVRVPSAHANFLHLVEHATLHHMFENGPLTLADLHFAALGGAINWPLLIAQAQAMGLDRALRLVAAIASANGATWVPGELVVPAESMAEHVDACVTAMLRDESLTDHAAMLRGITLRKGQMPGLFAAVRAALTPTPARLADIAKVGPDNPLRWLAYPVWLVARGQAYFAARRADVDPDSTVREVATLKWLRRD